MVTVPFWNSSLEHKYKRWWLPTENDLKDSKENVSKSWFSVISQKAKVKLKSKQLKQVFRRIKTPSNHIEDKLISCKRIRLFPNSEQRQILLQWIGSSRFIYNQLVNYSHNNKVKDYKSLRKYWVNNEGGGIKLNPWLRQCPRRIRDDTYREYMKTVKSAIKNYKKTKKYTNIQFKSKKSPNQTININCNDLIKRIDVRHIALIQNRTRILIKTSEDLPEIKRDCKLTYTRDDHFYLSIPVDVDQVSENQADVARKGPVVALDPGVRTFQTLYDPRGKIIEWGKNDYRSIMRFGKWMDRLQSKIDNKDVGHRRRYRLRKALRRMRTKLRNRIDDCHKKLIHYLLTHYQHILLPDFKTKSMVRKDSRRIRSKTVRSMLTWSFYRFKERLLWKSQFYPSTKVHIVDEHYTSKTCGHCGAIHSGLKSSKHFNCPSCHFSCDRDINGARNILLKNLSAFD